MAITHAGPGQPPGIRRGPDGLTDKQRAIVDCIARSVADRGYPPSMREIGQAVGLTSTSSVAHQFLALERKGALRRDPHRPAPTASPSSSRREKRTSGPPPRPPAHRRRPSAPGPTIPPAGTRSSAGTAGTP